MIRIDEYAAVAFMEDHSYEAYKQERDLMLKWAEQNGKEIEMELYLDDQRDTIALYFNVNGQPVGNSVRFATRGNGWWKNKNNEEPKEKTKTLKIYEENGEFVIERVNEFNHATKRRFITEEGLKEGLDAYHPVINEYEIEAHESVWALIINHLNK